MAGIDRSIPVRPSPERLAKLGAVAEWHRDWEAAALPAAQFDPEGRVEGSDYNLHYADVESSGRIEDAYQVGAIEALTR